MSTPPKYPFRSRREIHSGQPKVYSDAPNEESLSTPSDPTPTPVRGNAVPTSDRVPASDPTPTPVRGASRFRSRSGDQAHSLARVGEQHGHPDLVRSDPDPAGRDPDAQRRGRRGGHRA